MSQAFSPILNDEPATEFTLDANRFLGRWRLSIRAKILLAFMVVIVVMGAANVIFIVRGLQYKRQYDAIITNITTANSMNGYIKPTIDATMWDVVAGKTKKTPLPYMPTVIAAWEAGLDAVLRNAPALVVAYAPKEASNGMVDLTLSLSYFELLAPTLGLGTCWAGMLQGALLSSPELKQTLGLPAEYPHHYPMMLGYPKFKYHRLPERKLPKITWD